MTAMALDPERARRTRLLVWAHVGLVLAILAGFVAMHWH